MNAAQTQRKLIEQLAGLPGRPPVQPLGGSAGSNGALYSADNWGQIFDLIGFGWPLRMISFSNTPKSSAKKTSR